MKVSLQPSTDNDIELILAWRNHPLVFQFLYTQGFLGHGYISWDEHYKWWNKHRHWTRLIILVEDETVSRKVGYIQFADWGEGIADTGVYLGEITLWGQGIMKKALNLGLEHLKEKGFTKARADIVKSNQRSIALYEGLGFVRLLGSKREGEWDYELIL